MIKRLPRFAETLFASLCAAEGALCHHAEEDENGWDYLVEFPPQTLLGPADTHPPPKKAYVQVKSTRQAQRLTCCVKLSNALRAAQSRQPWFFVLVIANVRNKPIRIYAVHVWDELIRRTLEAVRRAENSKRRAENSKSALNRRWLTIRFGNDDERTDNLVSWMHNTIDAVGPDYEQQKKAIFQTVGYEDGYGIGQLSFEVATEEEMLMNFLGLGSGISLSRFTFTPSRFGITTMEPQIDVSHGIAHNTPKPAGNCEIRLRGPRTSAPMVLSVQVYALSIPDLPVEQRRLRFSTEFLDIIWSPNGKSSCRANLNGNEKKISLPLRNSRA